MKTKSNWNIVTLGMSIVALMATGAVAFGQSASCQTTYPKCEEDIENIESNLCDENTYWEVSPSVAFYFYACNNWYSGCGGSGPHPPNCNVMVRYNAMGRTIYCPGTNETTFCIEEILSYGHVNLNTNCTGGPCSVPGGTTDTPHGYPPNDTYTTPENLDFRPTIPPD